MIPAIELQTSPAGLVAAAAALAAGAPLFSGGLRALRLRRVLGRLRPCAVSDLPTGLAHVTGAVALESPLFSPLGGHACAVFRLEVVGQEGALSAAIEIARPFRLVEGGRVARVRPDGARFDLAESARREVGAREPLSENLLALLERSPEAMWFRRSGGTLTLVERVLAPGAVCHVIGTARQSAHAAWTAELELQATGTGEAVAVAGEPPGEGPDLWLDAGDHLAYLRVSDRAPAPAALRVPAWRTLGAFVGPALSLGGLLYLAHAADRLRAAGGP